MTTFDIGRPLNWVTILPEGFQFYDLGEVISNDIPFSSKEELSDYLAVGYQIKGDIQGLFLVLFDKGLDISIYSELGNIIASQIANQLYSLRGLDVMISPPQILGEALFKRITQGYEPIIRKTYAHLYNNSVIPVETWILPSALPEGIGHA